jgi:hypothetical protein
MVIGSELWGEKWCDPKTLLAISQSCDYVRSYPEVTCEGKDLVRGASVYCLNSSKKPGKSVRVFQNLHFEGKGT